MQAETSPPQARLEGMNGGEATLHLSGTWTRDREPPAAEEVLDSAEGEPPKLLTFECAGLGEWDSLILAFLLRVLERCGGQTTQVDTSGLPAGLSRLLELAHSGEGRPEPRARQPRPRFLGAVGEATIDFVCSCGQMLSFLGESVLAAARLVRGRSAMRWRDFWAISQETGAMALPIVSLISVLVGTIVAFVGAYQLRMFGAEIYVAAGVGLAMVREMAPMMTGIVLAGRTGAAFAAHIGTMQVNEEVDALQTLGVSPFDFLVMPRVLALALMMPMLCLYSNLMGIAGGAVVSAGMFNIPIVQYLEQTWRTVGVNDFAIGMAKSFAFGITVAVAGCMRGMQCGRSAQEVGRAATAAVVTGIVAIIVLDSIAAVITTLIGI